VGYVPVRSEDKRRRGSPHIESPDQVKPRLGINLDVIDPVDHTRHVSQYLSGRAAWRAERRRKLDEGGSGAQGGAEIRGAQLGPGSPGPGSLRLS
jgi:hypothetical protein